MKFAWRRREVRTPGVYAEFLNGNLSGREIRGTLGVQRHWFVVAGRGAQRTSPMRHFAAISKKLSHPPLGKRGMPVHEDLPLTKRERQIIQILPEGISNKEIGRRLGLTEGTVKVHLHRIYRKLGIANRTALAVLAPTIALIRG